MQFVTSQPGSTALVLDSPHSGTCYPPDFDYACDLSTLRRAEDTHVEKLYDFAPALGAAWIEAHFPRSYLDANRALSAIDPELIDGAWPGPLEDDTKVHLGKGLVWRITDDGVPIYQRKLAVAEVQARIQNCWQPYHAAVAQAIGAAHARHGYSIHLNCHSMPAIAGSHATDTPGMVHPDFVVGNRDDATSSRALALLVHGFLEQRGYCVGYNHPYKGVELVRRYGRPAEHLHSIQLEINRGLYMDENSLVLRDGFAPLQETLRELLELLLQTDPRY